MSHCKILYVCQEITPYLPESDMSVLCRALSQGMQERGNEIRTFMPRYGLINERRNQLHEVIRLSGMNLIIDNNDHQLIIKVASIPSARVQIYFIDNEDYFHRKAMIRDENGAFFADNDERAIFFARGVLETVKKLTGANVVQSERCCGESGLFAVKRPDIASQVRHRKFEEIEKARAKAGIKGHVKMLTTCPGCLQGLSRYEERADMDAEYIVVEMARQILGANWRDQFIRTVKNGGIEKVLV